MANQTDSTRLYLVVPPVADPAEIADALAAALDAAEVAAVLLPLAGADERANVNIVKALAPTIQGKSAALLLSGHADLVARGGADGAHLPNFDEFSAALPLLKPERIAGCGGLDTRHDAMSAAEAGADYVMFGEPDTQAERPTFESIIERVEWWAEVFEVPCVGYAASLDEVAPLIQAGADFVALGPFVFSDPQGPQRVVAAAAALMRLPENAG
jgi:thiamine-phosphate pyrophosphorylase